MTEKILKNNQAVVAGEIISDFEFSHEVFGEGFYFVKLKVSRLSHSSDIIPLLVSERLIDVSQSHIGQFLEARGQFRSYNKTVPYNLTYISRICNLPFKVYSIINIFHLIYRNFICYSANHIILSYALLIFSALNSSP